MSEVKKVQRWDLDQNLDCILGADNGRFVSWKDYAALKEQFDFKQNLTEQVVALQKQRDALAALAEERRQFIVNGVEMGDILLPVIDGEPAIGIHERCLLKPKFAYDAYLNSVRAEGVEMLANKMQQTIDNAKLNNYEIGALAGAIFTGAAIATQLRAGEPS